MAVDDQGEHPGIHRRAGATAARSTTASFEGSAAPTWRWPPTAAPGTRGRSCLRRAALRRAGPDLDGQPNRRGRAHVAGLRRAPRPPALLRLDARSEAVPLGRRGAGGDGAARPGARGRCRWPRFPVQASGGRFVPRAFPSPARRTCSGEDATAGRDRRAASGPDPRAAPQRRLRRALPRASSSPRSTPTMGSLVHRIVRRDGGRDRLVRVPVPPGRGQPGAPPLRSRIRRSRRSSASSPSTRGPAAAPRSRGGSSPTSRRRCAAAWRSSASRASR